MPSSPQSFFLSNLAQALLAGAWTLRAMTARAKQACHGSQRWLRQMARQVHDAFAEPPSYEDLLRYLQVDEEVREHWCDMVHRIFWLTPTMTPRWQVPAIATAGQLADWLGLPMRRLEWLADVKGHTVKQGPPKLRHYLYRSIPRRQGPARLLEIPKRDLKAIQRCLLRDILDKIPPHEAVHGFRRQRSVLTYVQPHVGRRIVLRFDLRDFFASVSAARVQAIFRTAGYPREVARLLTGLCTTRAPEASEPRWRERHLPQGAPTSPALANLAAYRLDVRLQALAQKLGAGYTRYADDLALSGNERLSRAARRVQILAAVIATEEGFALNFRKSRFMRSSVRQQLAGVVVNVRPNLRREAFDELKAILTNCARHGAATQNRAGHADFRRHLQGRINHVKQLHPRRGAKLQALFDRIAWPIE